MKKMTKRQVAVIGLILACPPILFSLDSPTSKGLKLEPQPKEVQLREGGFQVGPQTKIFVQLGHQAEDRIAAETLADEVQSQSGLQLNILGMKAEGKAEDGAIVLARLDDDRVRHFLARNGLRADSAVGSSGYLLFSDKDHLIVAANSGEGLFYGVQTLRQLLRPAGNGLICPAVGIRDWPSLQKSVHESLSKLGNTNLQAGPQ
jgi:hexosaminidase